MYKKNAEPKKRKMAFTIEGCNKILENSERGHIIPTAASMYFPDKTSEMGAL
jgi:hypothetical protein